ncbi:MAG: ATP-binding protein [candidate division Zixibacteria bacterium]|nr:ATP-binding protein [candidate division Zixibacteria bacterium]
MQFGDFRIDKSIDPHLVIYENVNKICDACILSLKLTTDLRVKVRTEYCQQPIVLVARNELYQMIQNILKNAMEAAVKSDKSDSPIVRIITNIVYSTELSKTVVSIKIIDNGPGIDDLIKHDIFKDGFTTNIPSEGRGHGLWIAKTLAQKWDGDVKADNMVIDGKGNGACFELLLPYHAVPEKEKAGDAI